MNSIREVNGNIITLSENNSFDLITHGCNCFCRMGSGVARDIAATWPMALEADKKTEIGDYNKLGNYTVATTTINGQEFKIVNSYTQYNYGRDGKQYVDYEAVTLCMRKINVNFVGKRIGLPLIGAGLAGGEWKIIKEIIRKELKDMHVTIIHFK